MSLLLLISGFDNDWIFSHFLGFIWIKSEVICEKFVKNAYHILIVHKMRQFGEVVVKFWHLMKRSYGFASFNWLQWKIWYFTKIPLQRELMPNKKQKFTVLFILSSITCVIHPCYLVFRLFYSIWQKLFPHGLFHNVLLLPLYK